jgi:hypothetical protein
MLPANAPKLVTRPTLVAGVTSAITPNSVDEKP